MPERLRVSRDRVRAYGVPPSDEVRLSQQCVAILKRLQQGPATNVELAEIALKYTSRISDLRQAGFNIPEPTKGPGGIRIYVLLQNVGRLPQQIVLEL